MKKNRITGIEPVVTLKPSKDILTKVIKKGIEGGSIKILQEESLTLTEQKEIVRKLNMFIGDETERIQEVSKILLSEIASEGAEHVLRRLATLADVLTNALAKKTTDLILTEKTMEVKE